MSAPNLSRAHWRKSSRSSQNGQCVECADLEDGSMAVRDSKDPNGPVLVIDREPWNAFVAAVRGGEFDL